MSGPYDNTPLPQLADEVARWLKCEPEDIATEGDRGIFLTTEQARQLLNLL